MDNSIYHPLDDSIEEITEGNDQQEDEDIQILGFDDSQIERLIESHGENHDTSVGGIGIRSGGGR